MSNKRKTNRIADAAVKTKKLRRSNRIKKAARITGPTSYHRFYRINAPRIVRPKKKISPTGLFLFDRLPLELRRMIYRHLIIHSHIGEPKSPTLRKKYWQGSRSQWLSDCSKVLASEIGDTANYMEAGMVFTIPEVLSKSGLPIYHEQLLPSFIPGFRVKSKFIKKLALRISMSNILPVGPWYEEWRGHCTREFRLWFPSIKVLYVRILFDTMWYDDVASGDVERAVSALKPYLRELGKVRATVRFQISAQHYGSDAEKTVALITERINEQDWPGVTFIPNDGTNGVERITF